MNYLNKYVFSQLFFFLTLFFGSSGNFLASPPGNLPLHPTKKKEINGNKMINLRYLIEFILVS